MNEYAGAMMARSGFPYKSSNLLSPLLASFVLQVQEIGAQKDSSLVTCLKRWFQEAEKTAKESAAQLQGLGIDPSEVTVESTTNLIEKYRSLPATKVFC